jgi:2-dehydropantoate 2-reductase
LEDARGPQWDKVVFNSATSPLAALTGLPMGPLCEDPALRAEVDALVAEAVAAASALFHSPSGDLADRLAASAHVLPVPTSSLSGGLPVTRDGRVVGGVGVAGPAPFRCHEVAAEALAAYR